MAIELHHDFGSKQLVENLNTLGHCVSYNEVRRFLTSAAVDLGNQVRNFLLPRGLENVRSEDGSPVMDSAIDNFDQNEETLDGKSTTHALAGVLFLRGAGDVVVPEIKRGEKKSLSGTEFLDLDNDTLQR